MTAEFERKHPRTGGKFAVKNHDHPGTEILTDTTMPVEDALAAWYGQATVAAAVSDPDIDPFLSINEASVDVLYELLDKYRDDETMAGLIHDCDEWEDRRRQLDDQLDNTLKDADIDHDGWAISDQDAARLCQGFTAWLDLKPVLPDWYPSVYVVADDDGTFARVGGKHAGDGWSEIVYALNDFDTDITPAKPYDPHKAELRARLHMAKITAAGMFAGMKWSDQAGLFHVAQFDNETDARQRAGWSGYTEPGETGDGWFEMVAAGSRDTMRIHTPKAGI